MQERSSPGKDFPYQELHWFLQVPTNILVDEGWVDKDFSLAQHNEVWEAAYPLRNKSEKARELLNKSCMGKLLSEDEMIELQGEKR